MFSFECDFLWVYLFLRFAELPESVNLCFSTKFEQVSAITSRNFKLVPVPAFVCSPLSTPGTWVLDLLLCHGSLYLRPWRGSFLPLCWSDQIISSHLFSSSLTPSVIALSSSLSQSSEHFISVVFFSSKVSTCFFFFLTAISLLWTYVFPFILRMCTLYLMIIIAALKCGIFDI